MGIELLFLVVIQFVFVGTNGYVIEVLEPGNSTENNLLLQETLNLINSQLTAHGSSLTLQLTKFSRQKEVYEYGHSLLKRDVIAIFSLGQDPVKECILSAVSGVPIFRLHPHETTELKQFGFCDNLISMSANYFSYAAATERILDSFKWTKIALIFEGQRFYQSLYFQSLAANKDYQISYIQIADQLTNVTRILDEAKNVMKTLAVSDVDVILLYAGDHYKSVLLAMEACNPKTSYLWIIQESITANMSSHPDNMVVGFHLPREKRSSSSNSSIKIEDSINLLYDATSVVSIAMNKLLQTGMWLPGSNTSSWLLNRRKLYEQAIKTVLIGKTGFIKFDKKGQRLVEQLSIVNLRNGAFVQIGAWLKSSTSLRLDGEIKKNIEKPKQAGTLQGRKLSVTTMVAEPFVFKNKLPDGTIKYTGFCIDLLQKLASDLKFTYEIHEPPDLEYGFIKNGSWNGMIREIMDGKADMIVADITITGKRETVVDFTVGYMYYREDMIMRKTPIEHIDFLQFMAPFSQTVWLMLLGGFVFVSLALFVLNYFSPYGNKNDQGVKTSEEFQVFNCFWFSAACMLQQGADHIPKAISGRILVIFFWFSILIFVSTYTANLAAFFTVNNFVFPITSFQQAIDSTEYEIGLSAKSHLYTFFEYSKVDLYIRAWKKMKNIPKDNAAGIQWARNRRYIHIANGPLLDYEINKPPCDLIKIPGLETPKSYGFALKTNDLHLNQLSLGILHLRENGFVEILRKKYWNSNGKCNVNDQQKISRRAIKLSSLAGVYVVLAIGCLLAVIALTLETYWYHKGPRIREKVNALCEGENVFGFERKVFKRTNNVDMGQVNHGAEGEER